MDTRRRWLIAGVTVGTLAAAGGTALATGGPGLGDTDTPITDEDALAAATAAALAHTGEGRVTETEVGDEESYYEVEVTLPDGRQVDVQLDRDFTVVGDEVDGQGDDD